MGDQKNAKAHCIAQRDQQLVKRGGPNGVESCGRLIEKQNIRVQGECPGKRGTFHHAPRERFWKLSGGMRGQAYQRELDTRQILGLFPREFGVLDKRQRNVFLQVERTKQRPTLKEHPKAPLDLAALGLT